MHHKSLNKIALLLLTVMALPSVTSAATFTYTTNNTEVFPNPERGWHKRIQIVGDAAYNSEISGSKTPAQLRTQFEGMKNAGYTLLHSYINLNNYKSTATLPQGLLDSLDAGLGVVSDLKMKIIVRPSYSQTGGATNVSASVILSHIEQINAVIRDNRDAVMALEAGYVGPWGEWHTDSLADFSNATTAETRYRIAKKILETSDVAGVPIPVEIRYPVALKEILDITPPSGTTALTQLERDRLGHHNDCFLYNETDRGTYNKSTWLPNFSGTPIQKQYVFDMLTSTGANRMMGGETCNGNGRNDSGAVTVQNEMRDLNFTEINVDFWSGAIDLWKNTNLSASGNDPAETAYQRLSRKMGYRLRLVDATFPTTASAGDTFAFSANLFNDGYASPIRSRQVVLVLFNASERWEYVLSDPSTNNPVEANRWVSGAIALNPHNVQLDPNMPAGTYKLALRLPDGNSVSTYLAPELAIRFANVGTWDSAVGDNVLHQSIIIESGSGLPSVSVAATAQASEPSTNGTFTFTRTGSTSAPLIVNSGFVSGDATPGVDYTGSIFPVTFAAGEASVTKTLVVLDDSIVEVGGETVLVALSSGAGYTVGSPSSATVTIADDDVPPTVTVTATDASAGEPSDSGEFTFTRTGSTSAALTVNFTVSGTATSGSDYTSFGTSVTIPAGQASVTQTVTVIDDTTVEPSETVIVCLSSGPVYTIGSPSCATVTIADDDVLPTVTVAATDASAGEPSDHGELNFTRTGDTSAALTVNFAVSGTATSGSDYTSLGSSVTIPAGQASVTATVTVMDNSAVEPSETVIVTLANNAAYTVGSPNTATVTITDEDVAPVEAFPWTEAFTLPDGTTSDPTPTSWTATPTTGSFRVLTNEMAFNNVGTDGVFTTGAINISSGPVTVSLKVRGGSGLDLGQDFLRLYKKVDGGAEVQIGAANGPQAAATWTANIASGSSLVLVIRAHVTATSEYYYFDDLSVVPNVAPPVLPTVTIAASDASAGEPSNNGAFTVTRTGSSTTDALTVNFTVGGTATSSSDYTAIGTSVTILAGQASANVPVTIMNDTTVEVAETVVVTLASNAAYTIGTANSATVNVTDDDQVGLPSPWVTADIGAVAATGSASYADPTFTIKGSGADIISTADEFRYVHQSSSGDCSIVARVASIQNTHGWAKAGVMVRESTAANARNFFVFVTPSNGVSITWRTTAGGTTVNNTPAVAGQTAPKWLRVTRTGNSFAAHRSDNGTTWTQVGTAQTISMATTATLGLAVTSHADGTLCTTTMDNVTATP